MDNSLTRWWIHKTKGSAATFTTAEVLYLILLKQKGELCLSRLRQIMAHVLRLESQAAALAARIRDGKLSKWRAENMGQAG